MGRIILLVTVAALCAAGLHAVLPHARESYALLRAENDPAALSDVTVDKALTETMARDEIDSALAANDAELAASFVELAEDRGIAVDRYQAAMVEAANAPGAQAVRAATSFGTGFITGTPEDLAGLAGTATSDLLVIGDIRDAVREGTRIARGEEADQLVLGLACIGLVVTAATFTTLGAAAPERAGLSFVKAARRTGRLAGPIAEWMTRSIREAVDTERLGVAMSRASVAAPGEAIRIARDAVKLERLDGVVNMMRDVGRIRSRGGTRAALDGLKLSRSPEEVAKIAVLAETKGTRTRAILKLVGRAAIVLTVLVTQLLMWLFWAFWLLLSFLSAIKGATERCTESYLRWKRRAAEEAGAKQARS
jgi:hypothetical protein